MKKERVFIYPLTLLFFMGVKKLPFEEKELKVKVSNPNNLPTVNYHKLSILQGDLKTLSEENKTKLCKSILTHDYFVPAFVWRSGEDMWILDATQRYHALESLEKQGYLIPNTPYIEIEAKDKKDAVRKLLLITSKYGEINENTTFLRDFELKIDDIYINIPELVMEDIDFIDDFIEEKSKTENKQKEELFNKDKYPIRCGPFLTFLPRDEAINIFDAYMSIHIDMEFSKKNRKIGLKILEVIMRHKDEIFLVK